MKNGSLSKKNFFIHNLCINIFILKKKKIPEVISSTLTGSALSGADPMLTTIVQLRQDILDTLE